MKEYRVNFKIVLYKQMSDTYKDLKDYKKAIEYSEKQKVYQNINDDQEIVKAIRDIDAKYQTKENKLQISSLKSTMDKGGKLIIFLLITIVLFFLSYQNMRRKKKIAEQEKLIQIQKIENILQEQELHEMAKKLGVENNVEFVGIKTPLEVAKYMRESALLVLPSRAETFGAVLIEALACGTPVVATRCGGTEDIVNDSVGKLVPKENAEALADAIVEVAAQRHNFNSVELRDYALTNFAWEQIARKTIDLYSKAINAENN